MRYLGLAMYAEGSTDYQFLAPLLRRLTDDLCLRLGTEIIEISDVLPVDAPANCVEQERAPRIREAALAARGAFSLLFVHSDSAGDPDGARRHNIVPASEEIAARFEADEACVVAVGPVRETEAWALADGDALREAFGTTLDDTALGLPRQPREVEGILDPKQALRHAFHQVVGKARRRRAVSQLLEAISLRIRLDQLRRVPAFQCLEDELRTTLVELGYLKKVRS